MSKIRDRFTNAEVEAAVHKATRVADQSIDYQVMSQILSENTHGTKVTPQLCRYWAKQFAKRKKNGDAYLTLTVANRDLKDTRKLRQPSRYEDLATKELPETKHKCILVIPDQHAPYHHKDTLDFLSAVAAKYRPDTVVNLGDECYPADAELLTERGWVTFKEYNHNGDYKVVQVTQGEHNKISMELVEPERKVSKVANSLLTYEHSTMFISTTPNHLLVKQHPVTGKLHKREAWDMTGSAYWHIVRSAEYVGGTGWPMSDSEIALYVAFQADGCFTKGAARFNFAKSRKAERLIKLLGDAGVQYTTHNMGNGTYQYYIPVEHVPTYFTKYFDLDLFSASHHQLITFVDELQHWDGTAHQGFVRYSSMVAPNLEYVHTAATLAGYSPRVVMSNYVDIVYKPERCSLKSATQTEVRGGFDVYCVTVPSGMLMVRQNGWTCVNGNCDNHAISFHDSDPNLDSAGVELEKAKVFIQQLHAMFPVMRICHSNHGSLVYRKAHAHGLPAQLIKSYREILFPQGGGEQWEWRDQFKLKLPNGDKVLFKHETAGDPLSDAAHNRCNLVTGHLHGKFSINSAASSEAYYWAASAGCLIDKDSTAFAYGKNHKLKPIIGCLVIKDSLPILVPMRLNEDGEWNGKL